MAGLGFQELTLQSAAAYIGAWSSYACANNHLQIQTDSQFVREHPLAAQYVQQTYDRIAKHLPAKIDPLDMDKHATKPTGLHKKHSPTTFALTCTGT